MNLAYDATADALYVTLSDGAVARTCELDSGTIVDLDETGALLGIEVINPARAWLPIVTEAYTLEAPVAKRLTDLQAYGMYQALTDEGTTPAPATTSSSRDKTLVDA